MFLLSKYCCKLYLTKNDDFDNGIVEKMASHLNFECGWNLILSIYSTFNFVKPKMFTWRWYCLANLYEKQTYFPTMIWRNTIHYSFTILKNISFLLYTFSPIGLVNKERITTTKSNNRSLLNILLFIWFYDWKYIGLLFKHERKL